MTHPRPNDWAAATNILLMSLGKVAGDLIEAVRKGNDADALNVVWWLLGLLFAIFFSIDRDRYASWVIIEGKPSRDRKFWAGTVFPNMVALLIFTAYQYLKLKKGLHDFYRRIAKFAALRCSLDLQQDERE